MNFVRFGFVVTGEGEEMFICQLLRVFHALAPGGCSFEVVARIDQRRPRTSKNRLMAMAGRGARISDKDGYDFGIPVRTWLQQKGEHAYVLLVDDLEGHWKEHHAAIFKRYSDVFNYILYPAQRARVGVFFFVMMLEAYYFGAPAALKTVLDLDVPDPVNDVESIRHPKNDLKKLHRGFDEKRHGKLIVEKLDLDRVLADPATCRSLRTMFAWIHRALGLANGERFQLEKGKLCSVTRHQVTPMPS